jgi:hypothetical protein
MLLVQNMVDRPGAMSWRKTAENSSRRVSLARASCELRNPTTSARTPFNAQSGQGAAPRIRTGSASGQEAALGLGFHGTRAHKHKAVNATFHILLSFL